MFDPISVIGFAIATLACAAWWIERRLRLEREKSQQSEQERFSALLERLGIGHWVRDLETGQMWWSSEFRRLHGIQSHIEAHRSFLLPQVLDEDRDAFIATLKAAYDQGQGAIRYRCKTESGDIRHMMARLTVSVSLDQRRIAYGFALDLTPLVQLEEQLAERSAYLEAIVKHLPMGLSVFDHNLHLRFWNTRFPEVLNLPGDLIREGVDFADLIRVPALRGEYGPGDVEQLVQSRRALALKFEPHRFERVHPNGRTHLVIGEPIRRNGQTIGFVSTYTDITEQKARETAIKQLARTDPLTGLDNRGAFQTGLKQAVAQSLRHQRILAVLFIDMDRFKAINDSLGHDTGDQVLIEIADRLKRRLRLSDLVARMGGDEFVVALTEIDNATDAGHVAAELIHALSVPFVTHRGELHLSPSIGISLTPQDTTDEAELLRLADLAMYHAKHAGGAGFRFFTPAMNEEVMRRIDVERRLRQAIDQDALSLHFQPIHGLSDGLPLLGFEALLRWPQPDGRFIPPDEFIPIAESTELIRLIGHWVWRSVARHLAEWRGAHPELAAGNWRISINLSPREFEQVSLVQDIESALHAAGESLQRVTLEITEGVMMGDPTQAQKQLLALREKGAQCAVDDFGTGYSSPSYLHRFAIDCLKIDRSFIGSLGPEPDTQAIVTAAIGVAQQLGLKTVAEGVETIDQLKWLQAMGCHAAQGYLLSRPLPADQVPDYLKRVHMGLHQPAVSHSG